MMQLIEKGFSTVTQEGVIDDDINLVVNVNGGGTLEILSKVGNDWVVVKTIATENEICTINAVSLLPIRLQVTGTVAYHVYY